MSKFWENWRSPELDRGLWQECKFVSGVLVNREKVGKRKKASSPTSAKWIRRRYRSGGAQPPSHSLCWFSFYPPSRLRAQSTATKMIATIYLGQLTFPFFPQFSFVSALFVIVTLPSLLICRVSQSANASEIKKAYYKLSLK